MLTFRSLPISHSCLTPSSGAASFCTTRTDTLRGSNRRSRSPVRNQVPYRSVKLRGREHPKGRVSTTDIHRSAHSGRRSSSSRHFPGAPRAGKHSINSTCWIRIVDHRQLKSTQGYARSQQHNDIAEQKTNESRNRLGTENDRERHTLRFICEIYHAEIRHDSGSGGTGSACMCVCMLFCVRAN